MADLSRFPITARWPATNPDAIQLYAFPTPNGVKISIALEELALPYEAHKVTLKPEDVKSPEFLTLNPNGKIPAIIDPDGPDGQPACVFESGAILIYLAEKTGKLIGNGTPERLEILQWLMFQMGGIGPMFGQLGYFYRGDGKAIEDRRPKDRYIAETRRLLSVVEQRLDGREWLCGDYSIADIATGPWLRILDMYGAREAVGWWDFPNCIAYLDRFLARPAVQVGLVTPPRD
jgi:GST-like protein